MLCNNRWQIWKLKNAIVAYFVWPNSKKMNPWYNGTSIPCIPKLPFFVHFFLHYLAPFFMAIFRNFISTYVLSCSFYNSIWGKYESGEHRWYFFAASIDSFILMYFTYRGSLTNALVENCEKKIIFFT